MTKTILLADDSLTIQKVVELTFADTHYNVVAVSSGDELLEKIPEVQPELIICDIIMPGRDGYDVCQDIKSSPDTLHIPVILLSGTFEPLDRDRALAVGCSEILTKPFEARKLIDTVEKLLSREEAGTARVAHEEPRPSADTGPVSRPAPVGGAEFGTRMSASAEEAGEPADGGGDGEALDFTETGFAEMEAAGRPSGDAGTDLTAEGLEFEIGGDSEIDPFADLDDDPTRGGDAADAFDGDQDPFSDIDDQADKMTTTGEIFTDDEPFRADVGARDPGFDRPSAVLRGSTEAGFDAQVEGGIGGAPPVEGPSPEPDFELQSVEEAFGEPPPFTADTDTAPLPPLGEDVEDEVEDAAPDHEPAAGEASAAGPLSDDDVDRIARRLLELAEEKIERIAWDVIPDVAEIVVRERIRKLEAEFETEN